MRRWREEEFAAGDTPLVYWLGLRAWAVVAKRPRLYHALARIGIALLATIGRRRGSFRWLPFAGGWMIAILLAKFVGAVQRCPSEGETGAPCNWFTFGVFGALVGAVVMPTMCIWLLRRGRRRERNLAEETRG